MGVESLLGGWEEGGGRREEGREKMGGRREGGEKKSALLDPLTGLTDCIDLHFRFHYQKIFQILFNVALSLQYSILLSFTSFTTTA